jgi:NAD(P)-dependent dehydrogenase (short-subunit alcohol dehydrogenase family)
VAPHLLEQEASMTTNGSGPAKAVVVTGASTGIGEACALRLDNMGFIVFAGVRKQADGDALRSKASSRLTPIMLDVTDAESIAAAAETVTAARDGAGISGLVNNAGIAVGGPIEFVPIDQLRRQLEVNVIGQVAVTQAFMPLLRMRRGRIVNIGSVSGKLSSPFTGPYAASKFAMEAITDAMRLELRPWGMQVVIVEPGSIATPIWDKSLSEARQMFRELPEQAHRLYDEAIEKMFTFMEEAAARGIASDEVAKAVAHALTAKKPKTRYLVGTDARIQAVLAKAVPDRMRDGLMGRQIKLPKAAPDANSPAREKVAAGD